MNIHEIDRDADIPLVEQVMSSIGKLISSRQTGPGAKLPSIRDLAKRMQVSKSTVVEAYERLVAEGLIISRRGSGFYVAGHMPPFSLAETGPQLEREVDPIWMTRQSLLAGPELLKPGCGWLPSSLMPEAEIQKALRSLARAGKANLIDYSTPHGLPALRELLSRRLADRGIEASSQQILLTSSGTQAIDLLCRFLIEPEETVLLDDPCYFNFHALLRAHRVNVVSVPYTRTGPDIEQFEQVLKQHNPRLYITNSALHNPTGATLSPAVAHRVLKLAEQYDMLIIEDDIFADFEHEPAPRLAAFDGLERVLHIGSFSKTLSASVRCGFIAARQDWIEEIVDLKLATSFGGGAFSSELVLQLLKDGAYRRHASTLRNELSIQMEKATGMLKSLGLTPWIEPSAGMFLWCKLPGGLDAGDVARLAIKEGVVLAPGNAFSLSQTAHGYMRFNAAQMQGPVVLSVLEQTMERSAKG